jgi:small subunit ribosomal protein S6
LAAPREYELVLMLDPQLDAPARDGLVGDARTQIEATGTLKHENSWGLRKMAFEINKRTEADYRWLRFRIFRVDPDAPVIVPPATSAAPGPRERSATGARDDRGDSRDDSSDE